MGFTNLDEFDFIDKPPPEIIEEAISELELFGAIEEGKGGCITETGRKVRFVVNRNFFFPIIFKFFFCCLDGWISFRT